MPTDDAMFAEVPIGSSEHLACSPTQPTDVRWRGILIRGPRRVSLGRPVVPLCGLYMLDLVELMKSGAMKVIATDVRTRQVYSGDVLDEDPSPEAPPPDRTPLRPEDVAGMAQGSHFTIDVMKRARLPAVAATYEVTIAYGGAQAEAVTIEVVDAP